MARTKTDIVNDINRLSAELPRVRKVSEIAEHEGMEIALNELTESCCSSIKTHEFKTGKDYLKSLEVIANFKKYLDTMKERAERIEYNIAELRLELTRVQLNLFEENISNKISTGITYNEQELFTGDVFETSNRDYILIIESEEHPTNYAITGTAFNEELLLQYPKNREILNNTAYLGNMFESSALAEFIEKLAEKQEELQAKENNLENREEE